MQNYFLISLLVLTFAKHVVAAPLARAAPDSDAAFDPDTALDAAASVDAPITDNIDDDATPLGRLIAVAGLDPVAPSVQIGLGFQLYDDTSFIVEPLVGISLEGTQFESITTSEDPSSLAADASIHDVLGRGHLAIKASVVQHFGRDWGLPFVPFVRGSVTPKLFLASLSNEVEVSDISISSSLFTGNGSLAISVGLGVDFSFHRSFFARISADLAEVGVSTANSVSETAKTDGFSGFASAFIRPTISLGVRF